MSTLTWTPGSSGTETVTVTATDARGLSESVDVDVSVTAFSETATSYLVYRDTPRSRTSAAITGEWAGAGTTAVAARDDLWSPSPLGQLTLASGSLVTPQADAGLSHDATGITLANDAVLSETWEVARAIPVANVFAVDGTKFAYPRVASIPSGLSVDFATGVITVTSSGSTRFLDFRYYAEVLDNPTYFLRRGDALNISITGTVTGAGQIGCAIIQGVSDADGTSVQVNATGDGYQLSAGVGALDYSGGLVVGPPRTIGSTGHVLRVRIGAGFAGTITMAAAANPATIETVTATVLGMAQPDGPLTLTGSGTLDLGKSISHVEIDGPPGATMIPASVRAGLDAPTDAHVYRVTTTSDGTGAGTLRHAVTDGTTVNNPGDPTHGQTLTGPRIVVFDVAGVWNLGSTITVDRPKTYVAGQTAPAHVILRGESVKIYANDVVMRHLSVIPDPPGSVVEARNSIGFGVIAGDGAGQSISRVWIDQWFVSQWADQAPVVYTSGQYETNDIYFTNGMVAEGFRAPDLTGGWSNFEKANHNLGMFFGARSRNNVFAGNIVAGCDFRTPQVKAATHTAVMGNYVHDHANRTGVLVNDTDVLRPAPIQISGVDDNGDLSQFAGGAAVTIIAEGNWIEAGRRTRQGGAWIAGSAIERPASFSVSGMTVEAYHGDNRWEIGGTYGWPLAYIDNNEDGAGGKQDLGASGRAITPLSNAVNTTLTTPTLWTVQAPTHASETRAWTLAHAGPRPNDPHTMMDRLKTLIAAQATKDAHTNGARDRIYRDGTTDPTGPLPATDDLSGEIVGPVAWTPPASPFATAANGRTNIENALEALNVSLGGTPWGNVDRALSVWQGGKLTVSAAGTLTWDATEAAPAHGAVTVRATADDGESIVATISSA